MFVLAWLAILPTLVAASLLSTKCAVPVTRFDNRAVHELKTRFHGLLDEAAHKSFALFTTYLNGPASDGEAWDTWFDAQASASDVRGVVSRGKSMMGVIVRTNAASVDGQRDREQLAAALATVLNTTDCLVAEIQQDYEAVQGAWPEVMFHEMLERATPLWSTYVDGLAHVEAALTDEIAFLDAAETAEEPKGDVESDPSKASSGTVAAVIVLTFVVCLAFGIACMVMRRRRRRLAAPHESMRFARIDAAAEHDPTVVAVARTDADPGPSGEFVLPVLCDDADELSDELSSESSGGLVLNRRTDVP